MALVLLVRHGETQYNREEVFRGRLDVPLNERGREQARATGRALAGAPIAAVWASPLSRAVQTAEAIAAPHGLPVRLHDGLIDLDFGAWQGLPHDEVRRRHPDLYRRWVEAPGTVAFPGGETLAGAAARAVAALNAIAAAGAVAVVSHRVVCKLLVAAALGLGGEGFWKIRQDTACINVLDWTPAGDGGFHAGVRCLNDTCHLGRGPGTGTERDF